MRINKQIKTVLKEISTQTVDYNNKPDIQRKYLRRLLNFYKKNLTEDEQIYLLRHLIEQVHYRSIITDQEMVLALNNIALRNYTVIFFMSTTLMGIAYILFVDDTIVRWGLEAFYSLMNILRMNTE